MDNNVIDMTTGKPVTTKDDLPQPGTARKVETVIFTSRYEMLNRDGPKPGERVRLKTHDHMHRRHATVEMVEISRLTGRALRYRCMIGTLSKWIDAEKIEPTGGRAWD